MAEQATHAGASPRSVSAADLIDRLSRFDGPPEMFLVNLLAVQCRLAGSDGGAIIRASAGAAAPEILAVYPPLQENAPAPVWLASAVEASAGVLQTAQTTIRPLHGADDMYGANPRRHLVMMPLKGGSGVRGIAAFMMDTPDRRALGASAERLEISSSLLSLYEMRLTLQRRNLDLQRVRVALETLADVNEHNRFMGAAMALCNEISTRWNADRVSLGFLKGRYVHLKAMSHTEKFSRRMKLVQDVEATMEECLDQDLEIIHPAGAEATYVARAAGNLATRYGPSTILSLPLRRDGEVQAVLTIERPVDKPFNIEEIESLRLTGELCTARLVGLHETDRWFGARLAGSVRKAAATVLKPKHTWIKLAAVGIFAFILFLIFAKGTYKVEAPFTFDASQRRSASAPFDGKLVGVEVHGGDVVSAGDVLARLETFDLEWQLAKNRADHQQAVIELNEAMGKSEGAQVQIATEKAASIAAQIRLLEYQIEQAEIRSPIDGVILTPDMDKLVDGQVERGDVLFEIAPLGEKMWAELEVGEDQIGDVAVGQSGELAAVGSPGNYIDFKVERITPEAQLVDQRNVFKVRVELLGLYDSEDHRALYPGAEGVAKIHIDKRRFAWIWTRKLVNWLRMKLWI